MTAHRVRNLDGRRGGPHGGELVKVDDGSVDSSGAAAAGLVNDPELGLRIGRAEVDVEQEALVDVVVGRVRHAVGDRMDLDQDDCGHVARFDDGNL